jgi:hypothetical protein
MSIKIFELGVIINCISIAISLEGAEVMDWAKPFGREVQPNLPH